MTATLPSSATCSPRRRRRSGTGPGSWRTTTRRARRRPSTGPATGLPPCWRWPPRACASCTRASWTACACTSRSISTAGRTSRSTRRCSCSTARCWRCWRQPALRDGRYQPLSPVAAWDGNPSHDCFVAALWHDERGPRFLLAANYGPDRGQCRLHADLGEGTVRLSDRLGAEEYERDGREIRRDGLFLDLPPWGCNLFALG